MLVLKSFIIVETWSDKEGCGQEGREQDGEQADQAQGEERGGQGPGRGQVSVVHRREYTPPHKRLSPSLLRNVFLAFSRILPEKFGENMKKKNPFFYFSTFYQFLLNYIIYHISYLFPH